MGTPDALSREHPIILFDGVCNLCNGAVQFIIERDTRAVFRFASLQSDFAKNRLAQAGIFYDVPDTIVLINAGHIYRESDAVLEIAKKLPGAWSILSWLKVVPKTLRDPMYRVIARYRYKMFGQRDSCMVPSPELKSRFL